MQLFFDLIAVQWYLPLFSGQHHLELGVCHYTWKQAFKRQIKDRQKDYPDFVTEFGHLEGDTIVGLNHKSAVITLVERLSKLIITLKPDGRKAKDIENSLNCWFDHLPLNLFKSITFDCGKEFSNWKSISNQHDISIFFADPGCPSQRGLNEQSKRFTSTRRFI